MYCSFRSQTPDPILPSAPQVKKDGVLVPFHKLCGGHAMLRRMFECTKVMVGWMVGATAVGGEEGEGGEEG